MRLCHHPVRWQPASTYVAGRRFATYGLEVYLVGRRARVGEPLALVEVVVGDLSEGHLQVLARGLDGHRPVVEQDLPGALEQPPRVARDAADSADLAGQRQGLAVAQGEFGGDAPGPGVGDGDGAPDGLVEDRRADAAVEPAGVALVLLAQREDAEELAAGGAFGLQLVETGLEAERVVGAAHEAHAADVLSGERLAFRGSLRGFEVTSRESYARRGGCVARPRPRLAYDSREVTSKPR